MKRTVVVAAFVIALAGCGANPVSPIAAARLNADVEELQTAATAGDNTKALQITHTIRADVAALYQNGLLDPQAVTRILDATTNVELRLAPTAAPTTTAPTSTPTTTTQRSTPTTAATTKTHKQTDEGD